MASMSLQAAYDQARQSLESNDLDRAIGMAQHILDTFPDNLEAYRILGEAYLANRQLDRAQESFERVLRSDPENIPAHVGLGITAERQGKLDRAIAEFEQALEIKPDMTELRSQLLRLYSEGFGSENAQLRLSRAGLARLYAKGHMLPQAITEFRQVISDQPDRFDAMVALAEALWRDGQEDEAIDLCRDILAARPESLKANLLLGYLQSSAGRPEGERYWQAATRMDPYHNVAQALFETLPQEQEEPPVLEEWDEAAWRSRRAADQQEQIAATRPMEAVTPVATAAEPASHFGADWLDEPAASAPVPAGNLASASEADDFLASLLALDNPPPPPSSAAAPVSDEELGLDADMAPFSLDDLEGSTPSEPQPSAEAPAKQPAPSSPVEQDQPALAPFSLSDLGLSDEEIASIDHLNTPQAPTLPPIKQDPAATTQFSLSELGLSDEEIAAFGSPSELPKPQTGESDDEPALTPFSLSDLGLSDEEIAGLDSLQSESQAPATRTPAQQAPADTTGQPGAADADANDLPIDLQPFSFDDLDLNAESDTPAGTTGLPSSLQPFSLEDTPPQRPRVAGFGMPEPAEDRGAEVPDEEEASAEPRGFSWQQATQKSEPGFLNPQRQDPLAGDVSIFSKLKQQHNSQTPPPAEPPAPASIEPDEHLGLFSLDDISLREDAEEHPTVAGAAAPTPPEPKPAGPEIENLEDALASGQIQPFSFADLGLSEEEIASMGVEEPSAAPQANPPEQTQAPSAPAEIDNLEDALASGQVQPFSFADLGLSEEEMAMLQGGAPEAPAAPEPTPAEPEQPSSSAAPEIENLEDALASGQVQPFSLSDLGLSDDEISAIGLSQPEGQAGPEGPATASQAEPPPQLDVFDVEPPAAPPQSELASGEEEGLLTSDIKPFSLTDLGLSEEEIEALGLDAAAEAEDSGTVGLGLTEEELEGLDGGDLNWSAQQPAASASAPAEMPAEAPAEPAAGQVDSQTTSGDLIVDRLIALGHQQGYVDLSDIIANFDDPESEAARIEEIGMRLHEAKIEIRDGDEVIDMDAEYAEEPHEEDVSEAPRSSQPPRDLDLVADDSLEAPGGEPAAQTPAETPPAETPADEPNMTPFSLADLGLTEEEIAALGLGEPAAEGAPSTTEAPAEQPAAEHAPLEPAAAEPGASAEPASTEPNMAPFSLTDLGLTEEEIAALGLDVPAASGESAAVEQPAQAEPAHSAEAAEHVPAEQASDDPAMTPFSLTELGLTDEEIAAMDLGTTAASSAEAAPTGGPSEAEAEANVPSEGDVSDQDILHALLDHAESPQVAAPEPEPADQHAEPELAAGAAPAVPEPPAAEAAPAAPEPPAQAAPKPEPAAEVAPAVPEPPAQAATPARAPAASPAPAAAPVASDRAGASTGSETLDLFLHQLESQPDNDVLRLSVARAGTQTGMVDIAVQQYKYLIRHSRMLDDVVGELQDLIADNDDARVLQRLHRTLGDAYSKQGRLREAIDEYSWTLGGSHGTR